MGKKLLKEELSALFSAPSLQMANPEQFRVRVFAMLQNFLTVENVSRREDPRLLAAHFLDTNCPQQPSSIEGYFDYLSKALTLLERQTMAVVHRLVYGLPQHFYDRHVQKPASTLGIMASGGTAANITALWITRNACLGPTEGFRGVEEEGLEAALAHYGYQGAVLIGSSLTHYSIEKAAGILGLGAKGLVKVPVDRKNCIDVRALGDAVGECVSRRQCVIAIVGNAGTTECGSIDPLTEIADVAEKGKIHFHVDAAWGAPLLFSRRYRHKLAGIRRANSVTVDGHKQLYLPIGSSMLLLRDPQAARTIEKQAGYMLQKRSGDLGKRALDGSRPGTALFLHAALHVIGAEGYEFLVDENIRKAQIMARSIRNRPEFELLAEPETNIVLYRYIPPRWRTPLALGKLTRSDNRQINEHNERVHKAQYEAGRTFVSRTRLNRTYLGRSSPTVALRAVIGNPLTSERDINAVLEDQLKIARKVRSITPMLLKDEVIRLEVDGSFVH